jgi:hypothetical protein
MIEATTPQAEILQRRSKIRYLGTFVLNVCLSTHLLLYLKARLSFQHFNHEVIACSNHNLQACQPPPLANTPI